MAKEKGDNLSREELRQRVLSRWDNEGGATVDGSRKSAPGETHVDAPALTNVDLVQLRVRVIALENLVMALLAEASDGQLEHAQEMATHLAETQDAAHHPLTTRAAAQMMDIIERAGPYRPMTSPPKSG